MNPIKWAEEHPLPAGAIVVVGGVALLFVLGAFSGGGSSGGSSLDSQFYAASAAQTAANAATQQATINANATTALGEIAARNKVDLANIAAGTVANTNASSVQEATLANELGTTQAQDSLLESLYYATIPNYGKTGFNLNFSAPGAAPGGDVIALSGTGNAAGVPGTPSQLATEGFNTSEIAQLLGLNG